MPYPRGGKRKKESERESLFSYSSLFCHIAHSEQRRLALARISFSSFMRLILRFGNGAEGDFSGFPYVSIVVMVQYVRLFLPDFFPHHT